MTASPATSPLDRPGPPTRSLDRRLGRIAAGDYHPDDFVIADAKDADMAFALTAAGRSPAPADAGEAGPERYRSRAEYLQAMRDLIDHELIDIVLTSAANGEALDRDGSLGAEVTLAVRANDTTDIWNVRGGTYPAAPSQPFRSVHLPAIRPFCDLVLYSMTLNNDLDRDRATVEAYREFRIEAADLGIRHFLEVFNPNAPRDLGAAQIGAFVNDSIVRTLAGVTAAHRPVFLKVAYNGAGPLAELAGYDPSLVVGVLGGAAGTTRDAFELLHQAQAHGARVALFGRKIQRSESQLHLVGLMRPVLRGTLSPADAVRAYHEALAADGVEPHRPLATDLQVTEPTLRVG